MTRFAKYYCWLLMLLPAVGHSSLHVQQFIDAGDYLGSNAASCAALGALIHNSATVGACAASGAKHSLAISTALARTMLSVGKRQATKQGVRANLYYRRRLAKRLNFALGIYTPYAIAFNFSQPLLDGSVGADNQLHTHQARLLLNYKFSEQIYIGASTDILQLKANSSSYLHSASLGIGQQAVNLRFATELSGTAVGFSLGSLLLLNAGATRWGLQYQSAVDAELEGAALLQSTPRQQLRMRLGMPAKYSLAMQQLLGKWLLGFALNYYDWQQVPAANYRLNDEYLRQIPLLNTNAGRELAKLLQRRQRWASTMQLSWWLRYKLSAAYQLGAGFSYEQSPSAASAASLQQAAARFVHFGASYSRNNYRLMAGMALQLGNAGLRYRGVANQALRIADFELEGRASSVAAGLAFSLDF